MGPHLRQLTTIRLGEKGCTVRRLYRQISAEEDDEATDSDDDWTDLDHHAYLVFWCVTSVV